MKTKLLSSSATPKKHISGTQLPTTDELMNQ